MLLKKLIEVCLNLLRWKGTSFILIVLFFVLLGLWASMDENENLDDLYSNIYEYEENYEQEEIEESRLNFDIEGKMDKRIGKDIWKNMYICSRVRKSHEDGTVLKQSENTKFYLDQVFRGSTETCNGKSKNKCIYQFKDFNKEIMDFYRKEKVEVIDLLKDNGQFLVMVDSLWSLSSIGFLQGKITSEILLTKVLEPTKIAVLETTEENEKKRSIILSKTISTVLDQPLYFFPKTITVLLIEYKNPNLYNFLLYTILPIMYVIEEQTLRKDRIVIMLHSNYMIPLKQKSIFNLITSNPIEFYDSSKNYLFSKIILGVINPSVIKIHDLYLSSLRNTVRDDIFKSITTPDPKLVTLFVRKGPRSLINSDQILNTIESLGLHYQTISPSGEDLTSLVKKLAKSSILISAHSDELSNLIWMSPGSTVIELFPSFYSSTLFKDLSDVMEIRYTSVYPTSSRPYFTYDQNCSQHIQPCLMKFNNETMKNEGNQLMKGANSAREIIRNDRCCETIFREQKILVDVDQLRLALQVAINLKHSITCLKTEKTFSIDYFGSAYRVTKPFFHCR